MEETLHSNDVSDQLLSKLHPNNNDSQCNSGKKTVTSMKPLSNTSSSEETNCNSVRMKQNGALGATSKVSNQSSLSNDDSISRPYLKELKGFVLKNFNTKFLNLSQSSDESDEKDKIQNNKNVSETKDEDNKLKKAEDKENNSDDLLLIKEETKEEEEYRKRQSKE